MRMNRFLLTTLLAAKSFVAVVGFAQDVEPVDHIVNTEVVSDEAVVGSTAGCPDGSGYVSDMGGGSAGGLGTFAGGASAGGAVGPVRGTLAGARAFVGDVVSGTRPGEAGCVPRTYGYPDLFYNFYTQGNCNQTNAQMYVAPVPVPPNVGHTFYTYQPFMPHEMLYWHTDRFHNYYDGGRGMNHTKVHYYAPPVHQAVSNLYWNYLRIPR